MMWQVRPHFLRGRSRECSNTETLAAATAWLIGGCRSPQSDAALVSDARARGEVPRGESRPLAMALDRRRGNSEPNDFHLPAGGKVMVASRKMNERVGCRKCSQVGRALPGERRHGGA